MYLSFINCNHNFTLNALFLKSPKRHNLSSKFSNTGIIHPFSKSRILVYFSNSNQFWPLKVELQTRYRNQNSFVFSKTKLKPYFGLHAYMIVHLVNVRFKSCYFFLFRKLFVNPSFLSRVICIRHSYFLVHYVS